jgi:hypothetical protein
MVEARFETTGDNLCAKVVRPLGVPSANHLSGRAPATMVTSMARSARIMRCLVQLFALALAVTLTTTQAGAQTTFTVTGVCCSAYDIDGQQNPTLTMVRGQAYDFKLIDCDFHPFNIQSTSGIAGTPYSNVTNNPGTRGIVTVTVPTDETADTLYYQCGNHPPMNGIINIVDPTTASTPTLTPTPTETPTPTSTPIPCVGNCNSDTSVTVDELLTVVNIALGHASASTCSAGDPNQDQEITVDEILSAVNNALHGCGPS